MVLIFRSLWWQWYAAAPTCSKERGSRERFEAKFPQWKWSRAFYRMILGCISLLQIESLLNENWEYHPKPVIYQYWKILHNVCALYFCEMHYIFSLPFFVTSLSCILFIAWFWLHFSLLHPLLVRLSLLQIETITWNM